MTFALDPLFLGDAGTLEILLIVILKVVVAFGVLLITVMLYIWWMRKFISDMQNRIGPSRAGPFGILQTLADGIKLFFKEDLIPNKSDKFVFKLAPFFSIVPALLVFTVVPVAGDFSSGGNGTVTWFGNETFVQLADPHIGILFVLAMSSIAVYGIMLAGWSSGSKYPLLGSVRASAQMVSYEAALGLALVAVLMKTGTLSTHSIALNQKGGITDWGLVVTGFVPFFIFFIATTAELNTPPFDLVEAEQELVGGFHTEYSSIRFALFFMAGNGAYFVPAEQLLPVILLGVVVGMGMGGLQSVSRSVYATMLPKGAEGEFMGFFSVISRFSAIWGPLIYSYVSSTTGNPRLSLPGISLFFVIGYLLLRNVDINAQITEEEWAAS